MAQIDINFRVSDDDRALIRAIAKRVKAKAKDLGEKFDTLSCEMDLIATHNHDTPLDFSRLLAADDFNLLHDVFGIERHLDRGTGRLKNHFRPRFAQKDAA